METKTVSYYLAMGLFAVLYTMVCFNGLESHTGYYGLAYKIIHPESFAGDLYSGFHPAMISFYSILVKIFGDLWLDDRFNLLVCSALVFFSLWAIDRIARLLGVQSRPARFAILSILAMDHFFIDNFARLSDFYVYRPSSYAAPIGLWMAYFLLKGKRPLLLLGMIVLICGFSFKNGWYPSFVVFLFLLRDRFQISWGKMIAGTTALFFLAVIGHYFYHNWQGTMFQEVAIFDLNMQHTENSEANPFMDGLGPFLYVGLLLALFWVRFPVPILRKIRIIAVISLVVYLVGGIYYTFSPDWMKFPFLGALAVSRSSWWTQLLTFVFLSSYWMLAYGRAAKKKILFGVLLFLFFLFPVVEYHALRFLFDGEYPVISTGMQVTLFVLVTFFLFFLLLQRFLKLKKRWDGVSLAVLAPILLTTLFYFGYRAYDRRDDLQFLAETGIMGGTPGARWVGINEYFREEAKPNAVVVALAGKGMNMSYDTSLKIRSGRAMPFGHEINFYFNYEKRLEGLKRAIQGKELVHSWRKCRLDQVEAVLAELENPYYLVVPTESLCNLNTFSYRLEKEMGHYSILFRKEAKVGELYN